MSQRQHWLLPRRGNVVQCTIIDISIIIIIIIIIIAGVVDDDALIEIIVIVVVVFVDAASSCWETLCGNIVIERNSDKISHKQNGDWMCVFLLALFSEKVS